MDKDQLRQLSALNVEIDLLQAEIDKIGTVKDSVMGAGGKRGPRVVVEGYDQQKYNRLMRRLKRRLDKAIRLRVNIEDYIDEIDDSMIRVLVRLRFVDNLSWAEIAAKMGGGYTEDQLRKRLERFLRKI